MSDLKRFAALESRMDAQLRQFSDEEEESPRRSAAGRAAMAAGAAGAGVYIGSKKPEIKAGIGKAQAAVQTAKANATEAGRTAIFRGMRKTAKVMQKGSNKAAKLSRDIHWQHQGARKTAATVSKKLAKGSKKLRKGSMAFFSSQEANMLVSLAQRISDIELSDEEAPDDSEKKWARYGKTQAGLVAAGVGAAAFKNRDAIKKGAAAVAGAAGKKLKGAKGSILARFAKVAAK